MNALVVVVNRDGKLLLRLVLADYVFVEELLDLGGLGQMIGSSGGVRLGSVVFKDRIANRNALVADIGARIITR